MIIVINYLLTLVGLFFCFYIMMSKRFNTSHIICASELNLWIALWLFLLLAVDFAPTPMTTMARFIALMLNIIGFKDVIKARHKMVLRKRKQIAP